MAFFVKKEGQPNKDYFLNLVGQDDRLSNFAHRFPKVHGFLLDLPESFLFGKMLLYHQNSFGADLLSLPGVARKTANVVMGDAFGKIEGIVVDTHVMRLSQRLKLTARKNNQGDGIEKDLMGIVPRSDWTIFAHLLIFHGRAVCAARKPDCPGCVANSLCPSAFKV